MSGDTLAVGAPREASNLNTITNASSHADDNSGANRGAVYVYSRSGSTWTQQSYIKAVNSGNGDFFGFQVALDGDTLAVSAPNEDSNLQTVTNGATASSSNTVAQSGAIYVYKRTGVTWAQESYIKTSNSDPSDRMGYFMLDLSGDWLLTGSYTESSNAQGVFKGSSSTDNSQPSSGAAFVFDRSGVTWSEHSYIKANFRNSGSGFGFERMDLDGDTLVVGAPSDDGAETTITNASTYTPSSLGSSRGAVYVFRNSGGGWVQEAVPKAVNGADTQSFGFSVSVSGDTIAVGATGERSNQNTITNGATASANTSLTTAGAVYIYKRTGVTWAQEAYIKADNVAAGDQFGRVVSLFNDTLAVSAPYEDSNQVGVSNGTAASADNSVSNSGAVYIYKRTGVTWAQEAFIKAPNPGESDTLGFRKMTLHQDTLAVVSRDEDSSLRGVWNGAFTDNDADSNSGAFYVYARSGATWGFQSLIKLPENVESGEFGFSMDLFADRIVVSNHNQPVNGLLEAGDFHVYDRTGTNWAHTASVTSRYPREFSIFALDLAMQENNVVVCTRMDNGDHQGVHDGTAQMPNSLANNSGACWLYTQDDQNQWYPKAYLKSFNSQANDAFGSSLAATATHIAIVSPIESNGATGVQTGLPLVDNTLAPNSGAIYLYEISP